MTKTRTRILLLLFILLLLILGGFLGFKFINNPERIINNYNQNNGPLELKQKYEGPNSEYLQPPNYQELNTDINPVKTP
jgi:hypothetical protein